jgi:aspartyl-tRNA(Asn)/glutamyl-tRNA(Gln) amidotransferase subunit C
VRTSWSRWRPSSTPSSAGSAAELNAILGWVEQLAEVDVTGVEPMTSVTPMALKRRADEVTDGNRQRDILANAPDAREGFFTVPKVVE